MKRKAKWLTLFLSLAMVMNCLTFYGAGDVILPDDEVVASDIEIDNLDEATVGEEIVEWREGAVRHYYLGDGMYQAVISASMVDENVVSPAATTPNSPSIVDTYISSAQPTSNFGSSTTLPISDTQIAYIYCAMPELPDNAYIDNAKLYFYFTNNNTSGYLSLGAYPIEYVWSETLLTWNGTLGFENNGIGTECLGTVSLYGPTTTTRGNITITNAVKSWYETQGSSNYGIALKRRSGTNSSVTVYSRESGSTTAPYLVINYTLQNLPVENGTYYIRNGQFHKLFMRTNLSDGVGNIQNYCELFDLGFYAGIEYQKWIVKYMHNGYYQIKNVGNNLCLTVQDGNENTDGGIFALKPFSGGINQQWKITLLNNGAYKIGPRVSEVYDSDWVMAAENNNELYGHNVYMQHYDGSDGVLNDQWYIQSMNPIPRMSFNSWIYYDGLTQTRMGGNNQTIETLKEMYQEVAWWYLTVYGIELKTPSVIYDSTMVVESGCDVVNNPSSYCGLECGSDAECSKLHHTSAGKYFAIQSSTTDRVCKMLGFTICAYLPNKSHDKVGGVTQKTNREYVVSAATRYSNDYITTLIQHELSHTFCTSDHDRISGAYCVMNQMIGFWCDSCYNDINLYVSAHT